MMLGDIAGLVAMMVATAGPERTSGACLGQPEIPGSCRRAIS
jgi:hypothetical protein